MVEHSKVSWPESRMMPGLAESHHHEMRQLLQVCDVDTTFRVLDYVLWKALFDERRNCILRHSASGLECPLVQLACTHMMNGNGNWRLL